MKCSYCGSEMRDDAVLCTACGRLTPAFERTYRRPDPTVGRSSAGAHRRYSPEVRSGSDMSAPTPPRRLLALVLGAILLLGVLSVGLGYLMPETTMQDFREATDDSYIPESYEELVDAYLTALSEDDASAIVSLRPDGLQSAEAGEFDVLSDRYGTRVLYFEIASRRSHDPAETALLETQLDESVSQYDDLEVYVQFDDEIDPTLVRMDVIVIDDTAYLYQVRIANNVLE